MGRGQTTKKSIASNVAVETIVSHGEAIDNMRHIETFIDGMVMRGAITNPYRSLDNPKSEHIEEQKKRLRQFFYQNTEQCLQHYHDLNTLNETWLRELASHVDLDTEPIDLEELKYRVDTVLSLELEGCHRLEALINRIEQSKGKLELINKALNYLKEESFELYSILEVAYLIKSNPSTEAQLKMLFERFEVEMPSPTYYRHRKKAITRLSQILFGSANQSESFIFFLVDNMPQLEWN